MMLVQGEGRGHMTQAIAVQDMLHRAGWDVCCVVVGSSSQRQIPAFFQSKFSVPLVCLPSPNFVTDNRCRSIRTWPTIWKNLWKAGAYLRSIRTIRKLFAFHQPDLVINFYEPLAGLCRIGYTAGPPMVSIAHQYVYIHPGFHFPRGNRWEHALLRGYSRLTAIGSDRVLAIAANPIPGKAPERLVVIPPVLRREVLSLHPHEAGYLLVYLLNQGYMDEIRRWHEAHPTVPLHCFTDSREVRDTYKGTWKVDDTLCFHALDDRAFLARLAGCHGVATTAGFETVCEAMFLGKPVLMVPVEGHIEQSCNARDFAAMGAGIDDRSFRLDRLLEYIPQYRFQTEGYRQWVQAAERIIMDQVCRVSRNETPVNEMVTPVVRMPDEPPSQAAVV
jgi:uncharacterized protein (TIGR00661 family)